ncbi:MAG: LemA family protein [Candidatus Mcinerneyibacterium aminivorans]|uniref:LemA family protein n=1 Tax=Candidatus Mcinerneyibacterium aminivorans TaxID=2703815 RepID=A0A5D0MBC9_9BACT|nr:MAG: LemA family protein [Candidatus Mcinerneyibacterium aminivorans]
MKLSKGCTISLIIAGIIILFGAIFIGNLISGYNQMVRMNEQIENQWSSVENQYQRRMDLIPNLVNSVKGYVEHEREVFTNIAEARSKYAGASSKEGKMKAANQLEGALSRLMVIVERYPNLKASQNFTQLMDELAGTENRVAVARRRYNESVRQYNAYIKQFPQKIIASIFNFEKAEYFEAEEGAEKAPEVDFSN